MKDHKQLLVLLHGHDTRNPVILQWMDSVGKGKVSAAVRDILYKYIIGLLAPTAPLYIFVINLSTFAGETMEWRVQATNDAAAIEQAKIHATLNYPEPGEWFVVKVTRL